MQEYQAVYYDLFSFEKTKQVWGLFIYLFLLDTTY
jgi:hypothetical protein